MKKTACPASQAVFAVYVAPSSYLSYAPVYIKSEGCPSPTEDSLLVTILNRYTI
jgi:hypothetical protein